MRKHRGILTGLTLLGLAGVAILGGWQLLSLRMPDPSTANREQLFRWLVLRDLAKESEPTRLALVKCLVGELNQGISTDVADELNDSLSDAQRRQLFKNTETLKRDWFRSRVDGYHDCAPSGRMQFLDEQITVITRWSAAELHSDARSQTDSLSLTGSFFNKIEGWIKEEIAPQRGRTITAVRQGVICWLATRRLDDESMETRRELARRIAGSFRKGSRLDDATSDLSKTHREKMVANGELLMEAWLTEQAEEFSQVAENQREAYVDERIDEFLGWGVLDFLATQTDKKSNASADMLRFLTLVNRWVERAEKSRRDELRQFVAQVQSRWFKRTLQRNRS